MIDNEIQKFVEDKIKFILSESMHRQSKITFTPPLFGEGVIGDIRFAIIKDKLRLYVKGPRGWEHITLCPKEGIQSIADKLIIDSNGATLDIINNASLDTDKFLVSDEGNIKYRTGTQLLSDIGVTAIEGDGTAGRKLRRNILYIGNGTNVSTLACGTINRWNGDVINSTDNIVKNATTGNFHLDTTGNNLNILASGLSGNAIMAFGIVALNYSGTTLTVVCSQASNNIECYFYNAATGASVDLTVLVDTGNIWVEILYLTNS